MRPWLISGLTLFADRLTKSLVVHSFVPGQSRPLLPPVVFLTYVQNTGAAFGLFKGQQPLFVASSLVVIGWLSWTFLRKTPMSATTLWACALIWGGAVGNLVDRLQLGYVIDFIDLRVWPVFNVGDSAITVGVTLLFLQAIRRPR